MGKKLSKHERACLLSKEILDDFVKGEKLSLLLQKSASLARLTDDASNQNWIDKEITASFDPMNTNDLANIFLNGRYWTQDSKPLYKLEHIEVLEQLIESENIRLSAANDPNISYTPKSQWDMYHPHSNVFERTQIIESIKNMQMILSKIRGRLYQFVLNNNYVLNMSEIVTEIFSTIRKEVENKLKTFAPNTLTELSTAYNSVNSNNQANWSNAASGCRRILMQTADKVAPPAGKKIKLSDGREKPDTELYRQRLKNWFKVSKTEDAITHDTSEYLFELLDSVDRLNAKGDKNIIEKSTAEKILIYTYLLLFDILKRVKKVG